LFWFISFDVNLCGVIFLFEMVIIVFGEGNEF